MGQRCAGSWQTSTCKSQWPRKPEWSKSECGLGSRAWEPYVTSQSLPWAKFQDSTNGCHLGPVLTDLFIRSGKHPSGFCWSCQPVGIAVFVLAFVFPLPFLTALHFLQVIRDNLQVWCWVPHGNHGFLATARACWVILWVTSLGQFLISSMACRGFLCGHHTGACQSCVLRGTTVSIEKQITCRT